MKATLKWIFSTGHPKLSTMCLAVLLAQGNALVWASEGAMHFEVESSIWSRFATAQQSYPASSLGGSLGGDWLFPFIGRKWGLGARLHMSQASYRLDSMRRDGVALHLGVKAQGIYELEKGFAIIGYTSLLPWAQLIVVSNEASTVNNNEISRGTLATYSQAFGFEFGAHAQKKFEFWIFAKGRPLLVAAGLNTRLVQYGHTSIKTVSSQPGGNGATSLSLPVQQRSILATISLGTPI